MADLLSAKDELGLNFVDIATKVDAHVALVEAAADAGLQVICQKPFAASLDEGQQMVEACETADVALMVHENWRFQSVFSTITSSIERGDIGTPFFCQLSFRTPYDVYADQPYLAESKRFIIEDLGVHLLDCARAIMGEANSVYANTQRVNQAIQGEDVATIQITHESGASTVVDCSYASSQAPDPFPQTLVRVDGSAGSLVVDYDYNVTCYSEDKQVWQETHAPAEHEWSAGSKSTAILDSVYQIQKHWLDCWNGDSLPSVTTSGKDNMQTLRLVEAAYQSAQKNTVVHPSKLKVANRSAVPEASADVEGESEGSKVFVGQISFDTMQHGFEEAFQQFGTVVSAEIVQDKFSGRSRGFGFVQFTTKAEADVSFVLFHHTVGCLLGGGCIWHVVLRSSSPTLARRTLYTVSI